MSLFDRGYLLGEGAFATMRAYGGRCFRVDRYLAQLARGAEAFGLTLPSDVRARVDECAARVGDARVRVTVSDTAFSIVAEPIAPPSEGDYARGIDAVTVTSRRIPPACFDASIKSLSYAPALLAQREVKQRGAQEGIQLALDGTLACGTTSNVFVIRGDELATPSVDSGCRPGIVREAVLELAPRLGLRPAERCIARDELFDEMFLTNSRVEVLPIATLDGTRFRSVVRTHSVHAAFTKLIEREAIR